MNSPVGLLQFDLKYCIQLHSFLSFVYIELKSPKVSRSVGSRVLRISPPNTLFMTITLPIPKRYNNTLLKKVYASMSVRYDSMRY